MNYMPVTIADVLALIPMPQKDSVGLFVYTFRWVDARMNKYAVPINMHLWKVHYPAKMIWRDYLPIRG